MKIVWLCFHNKIIAFTKIFDGWCQSFYIMCYKATYSLFMYKTHIIISVAIIIVNIIFITAVRIISGGNIASNRTGSCC